MQLDCEKKKKRLGSLRDIADAYCISMHLILVWCVSLVSGVTGWPTLILPPPLPLLSPAPGLPSRHLCFLSVDTSLIYITWYSHHRARYLLSPCLAWTFSLLEGRPFCDTLEYLDHRNLSCCFSPSLTLHYCMSCNLLNNHTVAYIIVPSLKNLTYLQALVICSCIE